MTFNEMLLKKPDDRRFKRRYTEDWFNFNKDGVIVRASRCHGFAKLTKVDYAATDWYFETTPKELTRYDLIEATKYLAKEKGGQLRNLSPTEITNMICDQLELE